MNVRTHCSFGGNARRAPRMARWCSTLCIAITLAFGTFPTTVLGQPSPAEPTGAQVLTRGQVHEAFAGLVTFNPEPGVVAAKAPPAPIEELPPEERPEGDNVTWIPGYWGWDGERTDFVWVSGTWRALPPGRAWMAGYWAPAPQGYQWTSGYWADATTRNTTYLPAPPTTLEAGPNVAAPSVDYGWAPGYWLWHQGRYGWRPGFWVRGRSDWNWMPAHYVWTPRGHIFVGGFWDYPVARRGVLFAPIYFEGGRFPRQAYRYSPHIVINLRVFTEHLFLRPRYAHYYFGDYYAAGHRQDGFYAAFSFQSGRHGYDPIFSHQRWEHRQDRDWERHVRASYEDRRDHEGSRPPRTWVGPTSRDPRPGPVPLATSFDQLTRRKDGALKFQPVALPERQQLSQRGLEVQASREQRRALETIAGPPAAQTPGGRIEPAKVLRPRSPIAAPTSSPEGRNPGPVQKRQASQPEPKVRTIPAIPGRPPPLNRSAPPSTPRPPEPARPRAELSPRARQALPTPADWLPERAPRDSRGSPTIPSGRETNGQTGAEPTTTLRPSTGGKGADRLMNPNRP